MVFVSNASAQNLLNNSSFEQPPGENFNISSTTILPGFNEPGAWFVTNGSVDVVPVGAGGYWSAAAAEGKQVLDLSGASRGTIQQTVSVPTDISAFNLNFSFSRNLDYNATGDPSNPADIANNTFTGNVRVFSGNDVFFSATFTRNAFEDGASKTNFNWSDFPTTYIELNGSPSSLTIEFSDITAGSSIVAAQGIVLDNITFTPVPEPTSMIALSCIGLSALGYRFRRKKAVVAQ